MIKKMLFLLCFWSMAVAVCAQAAKGPGVRMPQLENRVVVQTEGLNVRKSPSATAPRLMKVREDIDAYAPWWPEWSNVRLQRGVVAEAYHPEQGARLLVLAEEGEWLKVCINEWNGLDSFGALGYVMKKYTAPAGELPAITAEMLDAMDTGVRRSGKYAGYVVYAVEGMDVEETKLGRMVDGNKLVFTHTVQAYPRLEPEQKQPLEVTKEQAVDWVMYRITYNNSMAMAMRSYDEQGRLTRPAEWDGYDCCLNTLKLTDEQIDRIFADELKKPCEVVEVYTWNKKKDCWDSEIYDLSEIAKYVPMVELP